VFVLDTNTLIYFFRGQGNIARHLLGKPPHMIGIPSVVLFELEVGIAKSSSPRKRTRQLEEMTASVSVLPFGKAEARAAAGIRAELEGSGRIIGPFDLLIAGTALAAGGTLVTRNAREFSRVKGLRLEDWY